MTLLGIASRGITMIGYTVGSTAGLGVKVARLSLAAPYATAVKVLSPKTHLDTAAGRALFVFQAAMTTISAQFALKMAAAGLDSKEAIIAFFDQLASPEYSAYSRDTELTPRINMALTHTDAAPSSTKSALILGSIAAFGLMNIIPNILISTENNFGKPFSSTPKRMAQLALIGATTLALKPFVEPHLTEENMLTVVAIAAYAMWEGAKLAYSVGAVAGSAVISAFKAASIAASFIF